jgi:hypothetical protein
MNERVRRTPEGPFGCRRHLCCLKEVQHFTLALLAGMKQIDEDGEVVVF